MAKGKNVKAECDICGFAYPRSRLRKNSFNLWVCPNDWDGSYDRVNHAQNKVPDLRDRSQYVMNARPDPNILIEGLLGIKPHKDIPQYTSGSW